MKRQKRLSRVISMLLTFALVLGLLPTHALALSSYGEPPNSVAFKVMRMDGVRTVSPISKYLYSTKENQFYRSIDLSQSGSWVQLTYALEKSQPVSLELYKLNDVSPAEGSMILDHTPDADMVEEFLGDRIGYLHGIRVTDNVVPLTPDGDIYTDPQVGWNDIDRDTWLNIIYESIIQTARPAETMKDIYAFGYQGKRFAGLDAVQLNGTSDDVQEAKTPEPIIGNVADVLGSSFSFFSERNSDANIQNYLLWDGSVVQEEGGTPEKYHFEDGYYVIVMTPTTESNAVYNCFLAFEVQGSDSKADSFDGISSFEELQKIREEIAMPGDPVDLLTGSFTWNYTDFALYGQNDLKFTRYYESVKAEKNYGLGNGWTSNFTYALEFGDLYAQVTLPKGTELYFGLNFDGSYTNCGDYSLQWTGGSYIMKEKAGNQHSFTLDGQIQYIAYVNGDVAAFTYSGDKLTSVSSDTGSFTFTYNSSGNLVSVTDSIGRTVTLSYDGDLLIAAENPDGDSLRYTYDANGYLATVANFKGDIYVENTYDDAGRVTHQYAADFGTFNFTYDFDSRHNVCTGTDGYFLEIYYDELGRILTSTDAQGTQRITYNSLNQVTSRTDREGNTTSYGHDAEGNISQVTCADGTPESFTYDSNRMVTSVRDRNGTTTSYTYDANGHMTSFTDGRGNTSTFVYVDGNLTSSTDANGAVTTYTYDRAGNRTSMTDSEGNVTKYAYDAQGRLTTVTDAQGGVTTYEYTTAGKLVKITDAQGNEMTYTVDGNGFNTSESDWMGNLTTYERNTQNQITKVTDPMGNTTTYSYDDRGNLVVATDANGSKITYTYDSAGRMISMTDAMGNTWTYTYDKEGRRTSTTDPLGGKTTTVYDRVGRTESTTNANGEKTTYIYDNVGNTTAERDALGQSTKYTYDQNGNLTSWTDRNGDTWTYTYDANNRLTQETDPLGGVTSYTYDTLGRVTKTVPPPAARRVPPSTTAWAAPPRPPTRWAMSRPMRMTLWAGPPR